MSMINIDILQFEKMIMSVSFLVIVHNKNECDILFDRVKSFHLNKNHILKTPETDKKIYKYVDNYNCQHYYLASLGLYNIAITIPQDMGSIKQNASINIISLAIKRCNPIYIIMLGICASMKNSVKLTDVVIANTIIGYDSKKIKNHRIIERFARYNSSDLNNFFNNKEVSQYNKEHYYNLHIGNIVSSEILLDSINKKNEISKLIPEALAYEMEGIGLATSCNFQKVNNWIFIKGISDNGINKEDLYQKIAMNNAVEVAFQLFNSPYFKDNLKENMYQKKRDSIFISSSFIDEDSDYTISFEQKKTFLEKLSDNLIKKGFRIISGGGTNVGEILLKSAYLNSLSGNKKIDDILEMIHFPHKQFNSDIFEVKRKYMIDNQRTSLISKAKISLFIFGRKKYNNQNIDADGVYKEFIKSLEMNNYIIPIGVFGGASFKIWQEIKNNNTLLERQFGDKTDEALKYLNAINESPKDDIENFCDEVLNNLDNLLDLLKY